ncbi:MAG TPA: HAMP domain-containing sensor histidine kinase [Solirubrobacteraceae bacterium]|jgi:signal transduction histidine kinase|nr:HAMP domain-containing sensor histidine kinase [Solirubrobacteraceae bacterium]
MAGVAAVVLVALVAIFAVVYGSTRSQLHSEVDRSVRGGALELKTAMLEQRAGSARAALADARRYATSQPYNASSVLLFVLIPGIGEAGNHPELFGAAKPDGDDTASDQARENAEGRKMERPTPGFSTKVAPDAGSVRLFEVSFEVGGRVAYAGAGEPADAVDHAQEAVTHSFELAGVIGLGLALLAAYLVGSRIAAPIRRSADVAARIDAGDLTPRVRLPSSASSELQVMADALNGMLDRLATAFSAQREFVADASHELRTPLTVLRGQIDVMSAGDREDGSLSAQELQRVQHLMEAEIARLTRLVDDMLVLAQSDRDDFLYPAPVQLDELVTELWDGLSLIADRNFEIGQLEPVRITADPDRLAQALRNLARNAITHTAGPGGLVRVDVTRRGPATVRITVSDDGPGVASQHRERVFERFFRTDRARTRAAGGAGLGLAIVRAIAEAHRGSVLVIDSTTPGAAFALELPID